MIGPAGFMAGPKEEAKVIDLAKQKHKRLALDAFDQLSHESKRETAEKRAEVERNAGDQL